MGSGWVVSAFCAANQGANVISTYSRSNRSASIACASFWRAIASSACNPAICVVRAAVLSVAPIWDSVMYEPSAAVRGSPFALKTSIVALREEMVSCKSPISSSLLWFDTCTSCSLSSRNLNVVPTWSTKYSTWSKAYPGFEGWNRTAAVLSAVRRKAGGSSWVGGACVPSGSMSKLSLLSPVTGVFDT